MNALRRLARRHSELGIVIIATGLIILFSTTSEGRWANAYNIGTILQVTATLGLMAVGVSLVMATGEIDISVGSTFGMSALTYLWLVNNAGPAPALLAGLAVGGPDRSFQRVPGDANANAVFDRHFGNPHDISRIGDCVHGRVFLFRAVFRARRSALPGRGRRRPIRVQHRFCLVDRPRVSGFGGGVCHALGAIAYSRLEGLPKARCRGVCAWVE